MTACGFRQRIPRLMARLSAGCAVGLLAGVAESAIGWRLDFSRWLRLAAATVSLETLPALLGAMLLAPAWLQARRRASAEAAVDASDPLVRSMRWSVVLLFSVLGFFGVRFLAEQFGSSLTPALGVAFAVPCGVLVGSWLLRWLVRRVAALERPSGLRKGRLIRLLPGALVAAWVALLVFVAFDYFRALAPWPWLVAGACAAAAAWLSNRDIRARYLQRSMLGVVACTVSLAAWHLASPLPGRVHGLLRERTPLAQTALERLAAWTEKRTLPLQSAKGAQSCEPGGPLPRASDVGQATREAPDIVLITVDALRWDRTSWATSAGRTPRLLARSRTAAVFERAYTAAPSTRQGMRSLFTGLHNGVVLSPPSTPWGLSFAAGQPTMASYLRAAGYETVAINTKPGVFSVKHRALHGFSTQDTLPYSKGRPYGAAKLVDRLLHYWTRPKDRPLFLWTHFMEPHWPYSSGPPGSPQPRGDEAKQRQAIAYVDQELNRFLENVLSGHRRERAIVVLTADHGEGFHEHGNGAHGSTLYEEEIHVPLVVWGPEVKGRRHRTAVSLVDVLPTILELAGLRSPPGVCGQSLAPVVRGEREPPPDPVYVAALPDETTDFFNVGLVNGDDKLILDALHDRAQLYDLKADPGEKDDLAERDPRRLARMRALLAELLRARGMDSGMLKPLFQRDLLGHADRTP